MLCVQVLTDSGHITTAKEARCTHPAPAPHPPRLCHADPRPRQYQVAEHVKNRFCNAEWMAAQLDKTVNEIVVVYEDTKEIHSSRPSPDHEYAPCAPAISLSSPCPSAISLPISISISISISVSTSLPPPCSYTTMDGMKKSYLFIAVAHGVVGMRTFACWCQACMQAIGRGQGSLDSNLHCAECVSPHLPWSERSCDRQDAAGRANARKKAQSYARQLASQLERRLKSAHVLVAVQNRGEDDPDQ